MKYDYAKLLNKFTKIQYQLFVTLSTNEDYVTDRIYHETKAQIAGCSEMFLTTGDKYRQWLCFYAPGNQEFSYFDTELIGHITRNKDWASDYYGDINDVVAVTNYLIGSWKNKTKNRKVNLNVLQQIYYRYIRFLNTDAGQDFAYGKSLDAFTDEDCISEGAYYEDRPYWESPVYREQQMIKFKKLILLSKCKNALENLEMRVIWNLTFNNGSAKFNFKEAERLVWKEVGEETISHTQLFKHLKKARLVMLQEIYNHVDDEFEYFSNCSFSVDGEIMTFKHAIEKFLMDAKLDVLADSLNNKPTNVSVVEKAQKWADDHGLIISTATGHPNILAMVKGDSTGASHKGWKTYFYKGGGWKDFYNDVTGYYKDLN